MGLFNNNIEKIHVVCLGIPGCNHPVGEKCECKCHRTDTPQTYQWNEDVDKAAKAVGKVFEEEAKLDWRERLKSLLVKFIGWRNIEIIDNELVAFIAEVEKLAREEGKRLGEDKAREKVRPVVFDIRSSLKAELIKKIDLYRDDADTGMNLGLSTAIEIIKSA